MVMINGEPTRAAGLTLTEYFTQTGFEAGRVAVEINGKTVPRSTFADTVLADGDRVEIVHFVGGG